ncbi:hypothetical protein TrRE_jg114, partial [Triparma retinervis]
MSGYFDPETKRYVSRAMREEDDKENSDASALFGGAQINITSEAEELFYKYSPGKDKQARASQDENELSATVLNLGDKLHRMATAAFDDGVAVDKLVDLQTPGGFWNLNAALCVQLKLQLSETNKAKPIGCEKEFWATELVLVFFEKYHQRQQKQWELSDKVGRMWIGKRNGALSERYDRAVRKRAARFLRMTIGGDTWDERGEDDDVVDNDEEAELFYEKERQFEEKAEEEAKRTWSRKNTWSSNDVVPKLTPEEEHRRKMQMQKWKKVSLGLAAKMTKKERHRNTMDEFFFLVDDEEEDGGEDGGDGGMERGRVGRKSVTFDPVAGTNEGDQMLDKRLVNLPPSVGRVVRRHEKSAYAAEVASLNQSGAKRALAKKEVTHHTLGLACSKYADKNVYVEIKPLCARHFICRQPPPVPGEERGPEPVTLVCVAEFGRQQSDPVSICAGGVPPGYQGDVLRVHVSKEFSRVRMRLFQTPNIPIGGVGIDLEEKLKAGLLNDEFKMFVVDIVGEDEEVGSRGGYHGQFAAMM